MNTLFKFALAASLLAFTGCNKNSSSDANGVEQSATKELVELKDAEEKQADDHALDAGLFGEDWPLTHLNGESFGLENGPTIAFDEEGRIAGTSSCNRYMGEYKITGEGGIEIIMGGTTMMMCDDIAMDVERQILELLPTVVEYSIDEDSGTLALHTSEGHKLSGE